MPRCADRRDAVTADDDQARFTRFVLPHLGDAYTLAQWITGDRIDAEDVVQDACLRAFRAISDVAAACPRDWLLSAVRNCAYAWLRKNRPAALVAVDDLEPAECEQLDCWDLDLETPETALIAKTGAERLGAAILALPTPFREMLVLRDIQGLSYGEIADVTGVPIGTVMSRLARGRDRVIRTLGRKKS
jgi:RNA polymerase sigma-70 factor, ECF subfamily